MNNKLSHVINMSKEFPGRTAEQAKEKPGK